MHTLGLHTREMARVQRENSVPLNIYRVILPPPIIFVNQCKQGFSLGSLIVSHSLHIQALAQIGLRAFFVSGNYESKL